METIVCLIKTIDTSPFWSNLTSSLIVATLLSILLPRYLSYIKRPKKLDFFLRESRSDSIKAIKQSTGTFKYVIEPVFRHLSGETFRDDIYWHMHIPKFLNPVVESLGPDTLPMQREEKTGDGEILMHFSGKFPGPIFTGTTHAFHYKFSGTFELTAEQKQKNSKIIIYYFFSTEYGNYPRSVKFSDVGAGIIEVETTGKLYLDIAEKL